MAEYRDLGSQVNELVGRINGNYGTLEYSPVHYINQSISQVDISAFFIASDGGGGGDLSGDNLESRDNSRVNVFP